MQISLWGDVETKGRDDIIVKSVAVQRLGKSHLDQRMLKHSEKFKDIKDSYVIFITENDAFGYGI